MINMECGDVVIRFVVQTVSTLRDGSSNTNTKDTTTARRLVQRESVLSYVSFLQFKCKILFHGHGHHIHKSCGKVLDKSVYVCWLLEVGATPGPTTTQVEDINSKSRFLCCQQSRNYVAESFFPTAPTLKTEACLSMPL